MLDERAGRDKFDTLPTAPLTSHRGEEPIGEKVMLGKGLPGPQSTSRVAYTPLRCRIAGRLRGRNGEKTTYFPALPTLITFIGRGFYKFDFYKSPLHPRANEGECGGVRN